MADWMADAVAKAAEASPMPNTSPIPDRVPGRVLIVDGDYLAYYCAGNDDTSQGLARTNAIRKVNALREMSGAEHVTIHLTSSSSTKGDRFIIAQTKPYQAQRKSGRKPKNWGYLRDFLESGGAHGWQTKTWGTREADDGIAYHATTLGVDLSVIATADKDMQMIPGWHVDWKSYLLTRLDREFSVTGQNGLIYGHHWFWLQCLQGDTADNIPGLPKFARADGKLMLMGEKTALKYLAHCENDMDAFMAVAALYASYYQKEWPDRLAEQMALLWMRRGRDASIRDVLDWLDFSTQNTAMHLHAIEQLVIAIAELSSRVQQAKDEVADLATT